MQTEIPGSCLWERENEGKMKHLILYYEFIDSSSAALIQWLVVEKGVPSFMGSIVCGLMPQACPSCLQSLKEFVLRENGKGILSFHVLTVGYLESPFK